MPSVRLVYTAISLEIFRDPLRNQSCVKDVFKLARIRKPVIFQILLKLPDGHDVIEFDRSKLNRHGEVQLTIETRNNYRLLEEIPSYPLIPPSSYVNHASNIPNHR